MTDAIGARRRDQDDVRGPDAPHWIQLADLRVLDVNRDELLEIFDRRLHRGSLSIALDLHVASLLHRGSAPYREAVEAADIVYADGASIVLLARLSGAQWIERAPLTEFGHELLDRLLARRGGLSVALIGGPEGLAERAGLELHRRHGVRPVFTAGGFADDWSATLTSLRRSDPDIVLVGMGIPREALWVETYRSALPPSLVLTCGGWFEKIAGDERRAPRWMSRLGLEWSWRLLRHPLRLGPRYALGLLTVVRLAAAALVRRLRSA